MPGIDKAAFLKRIGSKTPEYEAPMPGSSDDEDMATEDDSVVDEEGNVDCGKMLLRGIEANDSQIINDALREAVAKYK